VFPSLLSSHPASLAFGTTEFVGTSCGLQFTCDAAQKRLFKHFFHRRDTSQTTSPKQAIVPVSTDYSPSSADYDAITTRNDIMRKRAPGTLLKHAQACRSFYLGILARGADCNPLRCLINLGTTRLALRNAFKRRACPV
jgi:hypothetical protein